MDRPPRVPYTTGQASAFQEAYRRTELILQASSHCLGYRLLRGVEEPDHWILLLHWDSVEGHLQGFRKEPGFPAFFDLVKPFVGQMQEMKHYEETKMIWEKAN